MDNKNNSAQPPDLDKIFENLLGKLAKPEEGALENDGTSFLGGENDDKQKTAEELSPDVQRIYGNLLKKQKQQKIANGIIKTIFLSLGALVVGSAVFGHIQKEATKQKVIEVESPTLLGLQAVCEDGFELEPEPQRNIKGFVTGYRYKFICSSSGQGTVTAYSPIDYVDNGFLFAKVDGDQLNAGIETRVIKSISPDEFKNFVNDIIAELPERITEYRKTHRLMQLEKQKLDEEAKAREAEWAELSKGA